MPETGRDRLRELLDAVLAESPPGERRSLEQMAQGAHSSPFHFSRQVSASAGEPPVAMRRRVLLERAAWQLAQGSSVGDAAWAAGYDSAEGFARAFGRAFGRPPSSSAPGASTWLPAPNGIHFHPPTSLWVHAQETTMNPLTEQLVAHDLDDTRDLLVVAGSLPDAELRRELLPEQEVLPWDGVEGSVGAVLETQVFTKEIWLASIEGADQPARSPRDDAATLLRRHDAVAPRWLALVRDLERRGGWDDVLVDALCDPPESFVMSSVVAHVLTYAAHRRQLVRRMLALLDHPGAASAAGTGDPILWLRARQSRHTGDPDTPDTTPDTLEEGAR